MSSSKELSEAIDSQFIFKNLKKMDEDNENQRRKDVYKNKDFLNKNKKNIKLLKLQPSTDNGTFEFAEKTPHTKDLRFGLASTLKNSEKKLKFDLGSQIQVTAPGYDEDEHTNSIFQNNNQFLNTGNSEETISKSNNSAYTKYGDLDKTKSLVAGNLRLYKLRSKGYYDNMKKSLIGHFTKKSRRAFFGHDKIDTEIKDYKKSLRKAQSSHQKKGSKRQHSSKHLQVPLSYSKKNTLNSSRKKKKKRFKGTTFSSKSMPNDFSKSIGSNRQNDIDDYDVNFKNLSRGLFMLVDDLKVLTVSPLFAGREDSSHTPIQRGSKSHKVGIKDKAVQITVENWKNINKSLNFEVLKKAKTGCGVKCDVF